MATKLFKKINTENYELETIQSNASATFDSITSNPLLNGIILKDIALISGDTTINHKLNKNLSGWMIIGQTAAADIFDKQSSNNLKNRTLVLNSSAICTVSIYVF